MINKILKAINWLNYNVGGLRGEDAFFEVSGDPVDKHIAGFGIDE